VAEKIKPQKRSSRCLIAKPPELSHGIPVCNGDAWIAGIGHPATLLCLESRQLNGSGLQEWQNRVVFRLFAQRPRLESLLSLQQKNIWHEHVSVSNFADRTSRRLTGVRSNRHSLARWKREILFVYEMQDGIATHQCPVRFAHKRQLFG
jgi:hypothetical protein